MSRRKENIRKDCDEIDRCVIHAVEAIKDNNNHSAKMWLYNIKKMTHRIKRTTWRGDKENYPVMHIDLSNRINTNQTTTANIDVSTIPYY